MSIMIAILLMVLGIVFLTVPDRVTEFLAIFVGAVITVFGILRIATVAGRWKVMHNRGILLTFGILVSGLGIFMLFNPAVTITLVGAIIGVFAIIMAFDRFVTANRLKGQMNIVPTIISGLIHLAFGIGMIYSSIIVFSLIIVLIGIYLLVGGVMILLSSFLFQDF
ncbi:MAG: HdeD family acid-resistance protein [Bacillota bacterium]